MLFSPVSGCVATRFDPGQLGRVFEFEQQRADLQVDFFCCERTFEEAVDELGNFDFQLM